jgi:hypothetical protein
MSLTGICYGRQCADPNKSSNQHVEGPQQIIAEGGNQSRAGAKGGLAIAART